MREEEQFAQIIGVKEKDRKAIEKTLMESYGFAFKQPVLQMQAVMGFIKFQLMTEGVKGVWWTFSMCVA